LAVLLTGITTFCPGLAHGRTWYVNIAGTGDAPTIAAAMDSAAAGDSVVVGPGHYETEVCFLIPAGVIVVSEMGPLQTRITGIGAAGPPPCVFDLLSNAEMHGFWVETALSASIFSGPGAKIFNNIITGGPGYQLGLYDPCDVRNNLFLETGQGISVVGNGAGADLRRNIVLCRIQCQLDPPSAFCNDFAGPDTPCLQTILTVSDPGANFVADPEFCGIPGSGDYYLQADSPCAPGNTPLAGDCGLIGPLPVGCGPVKTEVKSWGAVKSMYRE